MFEYLPLVLTGLSITASILYYTMTLRNTNKTRQTQMFQQLYQSKYNHQGLHALFTLLYLEWDNLDHYFEKYDIANNPELAVAFESQSGYMEGLGIMVKDKTVDIETVSRVAGTRVLLLWFKLETLVKGFRELWSMPDYASNFEYLANEIIKIRRKQGLPLPYLNYLHPTSTLHKELNP